MPITLEQLLALRGDKETLARIDQLVEKRTRAVTAIEAAQQEIEEVDRELADFGIVTEEDEAEEAPRRPARSRKPREPQGLQRSAVEYHDALDSIGQQFVNEARDRITGPDIAKAMAARGFPSKQSVMRHLKDHERWSSSGNRRATRYYYSAETNGESKRRRKR